MKKILFAIPTLGGGGAERVLVTLLNNLNPEKYDITLFTLFDEGVNKMYLNNTIRHKFFFKKVFRGNIHLLKILSPQHLYKLMIKEEYDIIISYLEGPTTRIVSGHSNPQTKLLNWIHTEVDKEHMIVQSYRNRKEAIISYNKFNHTIFVSQTAQSAFEKTFSEVKGNFLVKYNTVDNKFIQTKSLEVVDDIQLKRNKLNLISVGRFTEQKGYIRLLNIMNNLIKEGFNVHLYLMGKGEEESIYNEMIEKYELNEHVTIIGYKENPYKYVSKCDLFVCSSYREGYSTAVTESLIVGTPVVATLCSGMEELLGENNEYGIITNNNEDDLYKGVKRVLTDPKLLDFYKQRASERGSHFSLDKTVKSIEDLLESL